MFSLPPASFGLAGGLFVMALLGGAAQAAPYVPENDAVIVETLRERPLDRSDQEFRQLRAALRRNPTALPVALRMAQRSVEIARRDSDPRYLGYAEAALAPWHAAGEPPDSVKLFDAILLQSNHHFDAALVLLDQILAKDPAQVPQYPQALLTRASILQVQARFAEAGASCRKLEPLSAAAYADACLAELDSLTGKATAALKQLNLVIAKVTPPGGQIPGWLVIVRAEMAERMGDFARAEADYKVAIQSDADAYAKAAYADFLLDRNRPEEVIALLSQDQRADPLLLRLALAYQMAKRPETDSAVATLAARFGAARLRGDSVHLREESRFTLHLLNKPAEAYRLAQLDWAVQKEPADARVLLEAGRAAGDPSATATVRASLPDLADQRLAGLLK